MAQLIVKRSNESANRIRKIRLLLDGELLDTISNDELKTFDISEGEHRLKARIDWCSSNEILFSVKEGDNIAFYLTSFAQNNPLGTLAAVYYVFFAPKKYLRLEQEKELVD